MFGIKKRSRPQGLQVGAQAVGRAAYDLLVAGAFAAAPDAHLRGYDRRGNVVRVGRGFDGPGRDTALEYRAVALTPEGVQPIDALVKTNVKRRHFLGEVVERAALQPHAAGDVFGDVAPEGPLDLGQ